MEGLIEVSEFMNHLKQNDLVIVPRQYHDNLVQNYKTESYKQQLLKKSSLSFTEISKAKLWGNISPRACKSFAKKYASDELMMVQRGQIEEYRVPMSTVKRIQKIRKI